MSEPSEYLKPGAFARAFFGANNKSNRQRVARMCDAGVLRHVRIGERQDRMIPRSELTRFHEEAERNALEAARHHAAARQVAAGA